MQAKKIFKYSALLLLGLTLARPANCADDDDDAAADDSGPPPTPSSGPSAPAAGGGGGKNGVLDFEGDVIEGQRKRPDLFLQTEIDSLTLDAILYLRKDFNDFHQVDKNRRPGYFQRRTRKTR